MSKLTWGAEYVRPASRVLEKGLVAVGGAIVDCSSCSDSASLQSASSCFSLTISCNTSIALANNEAILRNGQTSAFCDVNCSVCSHDVHFTLKVCNLLVKQHSLTL